MRIALFTALLALLPACKSQSPGSVELTIVADPSLSDPVVASIHLLEIDVSGADTGSQSYVLPQSFSPTRQEKIVIRPAASSGTLTIAIMARSASGTPVAFGQTDAQLSSSGSVPAQVVLTGNIPGDAGAPDDGGVDAGTFPSVRLVAGKIGGIGCANGTGAAARFNNPRGLVVAGNNLFVTEFNSVVRQVALDTGAVTVLAGAPLDTGSADGTATARFNRPHGVATDGTNLYIADMRNHTIRQIAIATGAVSTLVGAAGQAGSADSPNPPRFNKPHGVVYDGNGNLYVADTGNQTIRKVVIATGTVSTIAGAAGATGSGDNAVGTMARFHDPHGIAFDNGNIYVADKTNATIRQIVASSGAVSTLAGSAGNANSTDGTGGAARFSSPRDLVSDRAGNLYVADSDNNRLRKIVESSGVVTTVAGRDWGTTDGIGAGASFEGPMAITVDGAGNLFVADGWGQTIRKVALSGSVVSTLAGTGPNDGLTDGVGAAAQFKRPHGLCVVGNAAYAADKQNNAIRRIDLSTGAVTTIAGGAKGSADGTGAAASFNAPWGLASDGAGNLYVADAGNATIRRIVLSTSAVTTLAGTAGQTGTTTNVSGAAARFNNPAGLAFSGGTLYVADANNHAIRAIDVTSANVTTLAGTAGTPGAKDATGTAALFNSPVGVAVEGGVLYVADQNNRTIRSVTLPGAVVGTLAGTAGTTGSANGNGSAASFFMPQGLAGDGAGHLYVADTRNHLLRKIVVATGAVSLVAGTPGIAGVLLGALPSVINTPTAVAIAPDGAVLITTAHENAVLAIQ
jgi:hypothetical protein